MLETLKNARKVKELRSKILFTLFVIIIFRIGSFIPVPYVDFSAIKNAFALSGEAGGVNENKTNKYVERKGEKEKKE